MWTFVYFWIVTEIELVEYSDLTPYYTSLNMDSGEQHAIFAHEFAKCTEIDGGIFRIFVMKRNKVVFYE